MITTKRLLLRPVESHDLNPTYVSWLNNPIVNQYLETRFTPQSLTSLHSYWEQQRDNTLSPWFAITIRDTNTHIGNIRLGPINWIHRRASISLFIGDPKSWGKGYASEAIAAVRDWSFSVLDLEKLTAGIYSGNDASRRAFEKCGFTLEGTLINHVTYNGQRHDVWSLGLIRSRDNG